MQIKIGILQAYTLPKMDDTTFTNIDLNAYMFMKWNGKTLETRVNDRKVGDKITNFN